MDRRQRSRLVAGLMLIALGTLFLLFQLMPALWDWVNMTYAWPLTVIAVGAVLLVFGLIVGAPGMAVPACLVAGIGAILYWQNLTGHWESWAYAWTLIPGFVGVGTALMGVLGEGGRRSIESGLWLMATSATLFLIFGSFLGGLSLLGPWWPVLLILAGVLALIRSLARPAAR